MSDNTSASSYGASQSALHLTSEVASRGRGQWDIQALRRFGQPSLVIDVGVGYGSPDLYEAFPDASYLLVEPLKEFEDYLRSIVRVHGGAYELTAVGSHPGEAVIEIAKKPTQSSLHMRTDLTAKPIVDRRRVPVTTLDELFTKHSIANSYCVKIDTEGHELEVVRGGIACIQGARFVIAEVSVAKRFHNSYRFNEFICAMMDLGFDVAEVLAIKRSRDKSLRRMDVLFAPSRP